ncbi:MAG: TPM domain-containing protein [Desulfuromonadales bacterium]|nr:TPM domain-containing protein [Desulfuromonadales bacterium]MBN2791521.1 TPM domain-containing protein [Desulfuromonadales bacterium]
MQRRIHLIIALTIVLIFSWSCSSSETKNHFIQDQADLFSDAQEKRLTTFQQLLLKEQDVHFFVVTLAQTTNNIDQAALKIFEEAALGSVTTGARGLLLVIDPQQQQLRIEVGYDLEGIFPDGFIAGLEYDQMLPFFQQNRIGHGIEALTELLVHQLSEETTSDRSGEKRTTQHLSGGAGAKISTAKPDSTDVYQRSESVSEYSAQPTPLATLLQYRASLAAHEKSPRLDIYTPETRDFFSSWLVTDAQQQNALNILEENLANAETLEESDLAVVRFPVEKRQVSPYFFKQAVSGWQLDFATMSQVIGFNHRNQWHFRSLDHPYTFAFKDWSFDQHGFPHRHPAAVRESAGDPEHH